MKATHLWENAQNVKIEKPDEINTGFNIGFDEKIPEETKTELRNFVSWIEENFNIPITITGITSSLNAVKT